MALMGVLLLCTTYFLLLPSALSKPTTMSLNATDHLALLAIKSQIHDPLGVTTSWNNSVSMCLWKGVTCGRRHQRVTQLNLSSQHLRGSLSPAIGNLSFLRLVDLQNNSLRGEIPDEIGQLSRLRTLILLNNSFTGTLPPNLSNCHNLNYLDVAHNKLTGKIPNQLGYLSKLQKLYIYDNYLTRELPPSIGNLSNLQVISLKVNSLQGRIPHTLDQLRSLIFLGLGENSFSGTIPPSIYNITSLRVCLLVLNQLRGGIPRNLALSLPNLEAFNIAGNNLSGPIPDSLANASNIGRFDISGNFFSGKVSIDFSSLKNLELLALGSNSLGLGLTDDLAFLTSLINCTELQFISIDTNQFGGKLPHAIANFSITVNSLAMGQNEISGTIPPGIGNLLNLEGIALDYNQLTGFIPQSIGKLTKLQLLALPGNNLVGTIPVSIGNLTRLVRIYLYSNNLQGTIPSSLGKCHNLLVLNLANNRLTGNLPQQILSIITLSICLDLSYNHLTGSFPLQAGNLKNLLSLDISGNEFYSEIPGSLGSCVCLEYLGLRDNSFNGSIPQSLISLKSIKEVDFSHNKLDGQIPKYFQNLSFLESLNLSYNHLEGEVPTKGVFRNATAVSLDGNKELCGGIAELHLPPCQLKRSNKSKISLSLKLILMLCGVFGSILLFSTLLLWFRKKRNEKPCSASFSLNPFLKLSYQQLLRATNGFSSTNLLGVGSFGQVYKGVLDEEEDRSIVAVKVMNLNYRGASKSFIAECEALRNIRHRNLVKIISACSSLDFQGNSFKALIYEFMPNGSLDQWLHIIPRENEECREPVGLSFLQRLNITIDVALALDYLHHHCQVPIIHCDVKPSNVLLDNDMVAHLGDFGLARFFPKETNNASANQTSSLGLKGTIGYAAPEYAMGNDATISGDVYSFGILILEMFTSKRPTDDMFKDGLNLHNFAKMALPDQVTQIADPLLVCSLSEEEDATINRRNPGHFCTKKYKMQEYLVSILETGVMCSAESPKDRMAIKDASKILCSIKDELIGTEILQQDRNHHA